MVLPRIPKHVVKNIENKIRDFVWNKKKSKIAYPILHNSKENGGLNLVNIVKKDIALKATWPQILYQEKDYAELVYSIMRVSFLGEDIWRCTLEPQDVPTLKIKEQFWQDVLESWGHYNAHYSFRIENQFLWYNSRIKIRGRIFCWKDAYIGGLKYVHQLFDSGVFKSNEALIQEFGLTSMRINSLKSALPKEWKEFFTSTPKRGIYASSTL